MLDKPQEPKWYQLSTRDAFMLAGMSSGFLIYGFVHRHVHPEPAYTWLLTPILMLVGAGIGEFVKRRRNLT